MAPLKPPEKRPTSFLDLQREIRQQTLHYSHTILIPKTVYPLSYTSRNAPWTPKRSPIDNETSVVLIELQDSEKCMPHLKKTFNSFAIFGSRSQKIGWTRTKKPFSWGIVVALEVTMCPVFYHTSLVDTIYILPGYLLVAIVVLLSALLSAHLLKCDLQLTVIGKRKTLLPKAIN